MIYVERAGAEDLETIIAIQRASFKAVYEKYQDQYDPYLEERERIRWKLVERPNSFYYFIKDTFFFEFNKGLDKFFDFCKKNSST